MRLPALSLLRQCLFTFFLGVAGLNCAPSPLSGGPFSIPEGSPVGTAVGTVSGGSSGLSYRLAGGNDGDAFAISPTTGELLVLTPSALDFETHPTFTLRVETAQGAVAANQQGDIVVYLTDGNDPPVITTTALTVAENSPFGTVVGVVAASDAPGQAISFSLSAAGNAGNAFAINAGTAQLTVQAPLAVNHETRPTFTLLVSATDNGSPAQTSTQPVTITVTNVNEAPQPSGGPFGVTLAMTNGTSLGTLAHNDPDSGQTHTFTILSGNSGGVFALNASTGQITVANATLLNTGPWTLNIRVADNGSPSLFGDLAVVLSTATPPDAVSDNAFLNTDVAANVNLFANDTLGGASTVVSSFGGGALGGTVTSNAAGSSVAFAGGTLTVSASGQLSLTPTHVGTYTFSYRLSNIAGTDDATVTLRICPTLSVGGVYVGDAVSEFCLEGGAEYVVVPVNTAASGSASVSITGSNIVAVSGPPTPSLLGAGRFGARFANDFETNLRRRERVELGPQMAQARAARAETSRLAITPGVPTVGATMTLNVQANSGCASPDNRTATVRAVSTHAIVMSDNANPSDGLSTSDYQDVASQFDSLVQPNIVANFGSPVDIDNNGRVVILFTTAVNALTPSGSSSYVGGFFFARDLFPGSLCPTTNFGEMFYMLAADPSGTINGNVRSVALVRNTAVGVVAHEFQHLINASRRLYVHGASVFEEAWLDEGLAHIAEELIFYAASGFVPRANLAFAQVSSPPASTLFLQYMDANLGRLHAWLVSPHSDGLFESTDDLATRGAAWAFLRYAADRRNGVDASFWLALANTTAVGVANVTAVLGTDALPWMRDFAASVYADDALSPSLTFSQPSWNFRNLYANLDFGSGLVFPLSARNPSNNVAQSFTLSSGAGAAYLRMGVAGGQRATVTTTVSGGAPPSTMKLAIVRRE
ncbi:MAG: cadherin domain-containing protein [Myxococcaceae bacterium]